MSTPRYIRRLTDGDQFPTERRGSADLEPEPEPDEVSINVTGLREKRLVILVVWLSVLFVLALIILLFNISLIRVLQMTHRGMQAVKFHTYVDPQTGREEPVIYMSADKIDLGHVIAKSGHVIGPRGHTMNVEGSRVKINGGENKTEFVLQNGICRFDYHENFVISSADGKALFSAQHPMVQVDRRIKKLSTGKIITNKIRSPINFPLHVGAENLNFRANEGIKLDGRRIQLNSTQMISLKTQVDGVVRFVSPKLYFGDRQKLLPLSTSPSLTASIEAFRVCVCKNGGLPKLFATRGNKPCAAQSTMCP